jgi:transposase
MGYRGKVEAQEQARAMRARNMTLHDIATELGVSKSSVSLWVRDVPFTPSKRRSGPQRRRNALHEAKLAQIATMNAEGVQWIGRSATLPSSLPASRSTRAKGRRPTVR